MRIVMMGTGTFAEPTFQALLEAFPGEVVGLVTQPAREVGRRGGSTRQVGLGMPMIALSKSIPVLEPESINSEEGLTQLAALNPDLLVVAAYGQILKPSVLAIPKLGAINVHASLLPKYRGAAPVAHAILNGETETGVTIIRITPGLDAGEMLARESMTIGVIETTGALEARLAVIGAKLAIDVVAKMKLGQVVGEKQDAALVTKAPKITKEMGLIDWSKPAHAIVNHIRAMQPWPTAYTFFHRPGQSSIRTIIRHALPSPYLGGPQVGEIYSSPASYTLNVSVGNREAIEVDELQIAGKKAMDIPTFLLGNSIPDGSHFGPERLS